MAAAAVLDVRDLKTHLHTRWGVTRAVDGVSFSIQPGETLGIVGESGSGKSMLASSIVQVLPKPAGRIVGGQILFNGTDLVHCSESQMRSIRGREIAMILQDPHQSLNPVFSIGDQLAESIKPALHERLIDSLRRVRVPAPERRLRDFPHQISGGTKQRVVGAMAMAHEPKVLIADEPTTALDVTIQAQYLRLLRQLQTETGVSIILITHDFSVVAAMCDRVAVMYAGRFVEQGPVREIFDRPAHPYTRALLGSLPRMERRVDRLASISGQPPALYDLPQGCHFAPRCASASARCEAAYPPVVRPDADHTANCWLLEDE
jgi:oligopeptide/dipeptide ABC transporter ATP-binding protein